jgi:hypothetical protein
MPTTKIRNVSGEERDVPTPEGGVVTVPANHQVELDSDHARSLLEQADNWEKVSPPKKDD